MSLSAQKPRAWGGVLLLNIGLYPNYGGFHYLRRRGSVLRQRTTAISRQGILKEWLRTLGGRGTPLHCCLQQRSSGDGLGLQIARTLEKPDGTSRRSTAAETCSSSFPQAGGCSTFSVLRLKTSPGVVKLVRSDSQCTCYVLEQCLFLSLTDSFRMV